MRLWPILFVLMLTACSEVRMSMRKGWVAERDQDLTANREQLPALRPHHITWQRARVVRPEPMEETARTHTLSTSDPIAANEEPAPANRARSLSHYHLPALVPAPAPRPDPITDEQEVPARTRWNWWAPLSTLLLIAGLAWAISLHSTELLIIAGAVAFVMALISARDCRDHGLKGQGFALVTLCLSGITLLVGLMAFLGRFR